MTNQTTYNEIAEMTETHTCSPETLLALMGGVKESPKHTVCDIAVQAVANIEEPVEVAPLQKLAAGPWVSLGGYFDYSTWADRDRFLELDKAIAAAQEAPEREVQPARPAVAMKVAAPVVRETVPAPRETYREYTPAPVVKPLQPAELGVLLDSPAELLKFIAANEAAFFSANRRAYDRSSLGW